MSTPARGPRQRSVDDHPWRRITGAGLALLLAQWHAQLPGLVADAGHPAGPPPGTRICPACGSRCSPRWPGAATLSPRTLSVCSRSPTCCWCSDATPMSPCTACSGVRSTFTGMAYRFRAFLWVSAQELAWWQSAALLAAVGTAVLATVLPRCAGRLRCPRATPSPLPCGLRWVWALTAGGRAAGSRRIWPACGRPGRSSRSRSFRPTGGRHNCWPPPSRHSARPACCLPGTANRRRARRGARHRAGARCGGRDVYLIMLESLGAVVYDDARAEQRSARQP
jgi:hypothetical protein